MLKISNLRLKDVLSIGQGLTLLIKALVEYTVFEDF